MASGTIGDKVTAGNNVTGAVADYGSCAEWHATLGTNETATGTIIRINAAVDSSTVTLSASGTGTRTLTAHADAMVNAPTYAAATSRARVSPGSGHPITVSGSGWTLEKFSVVTSSDGQYSVRVQNALTIRRCVIASGGSTSSDTQGIICQSGTGSDTVVISNVAVFNVPGNSIIAFSGFTLNVYHSSVSLGFNDSNGCTAYSSTVNSYAVVVQTNSHASTNGFRTLYGGTLGGDYNVSSDATAPGSNTRKNISGVFKNTSAGSEDLNLNGLNGGLLQGVADYSGACGDVTTDLNGNARPAAANFPIDPGCAQITSGPSVLAYGGGGAVKDTEPMTASINPPVSNCLLVAVIGVSGDTINAVDFNGTSMSSVAAAAQNNSGLRTYIYTLDNPATGSHTLTVDVNASFSRGWFAVYALKFAGDSNIPAVDVGDGNTFNSAASTVSKSTTTAVANEGAIDVVANGSSGSAFVPDSPQVLRDKATQPPNFLDAASSTRLAVASGSITDGWSFNSGSAGALSVVYVKPGSGGGGGGTPGTITSMLSLMGVG